MNVTKGGAFSLSKPSANLIAVDATTGNVIKTIDSAVENPGAEYVYQKTDASVNTVTVNTAAGVTLAILTAQSETVRLMSDEVNWLVVGTV